MMSAETNAQPLLMRIESIGVGGSARTSGYSNERVEAVVIASDQQLVSIGAGLTSTEKAWLAGFLSQAIARA